MPILLQRFIILFTWFIIPLLCLLLFAVELRCASGICGLVACCDEYDVRLAVTFQRYLPPSLASSGIQPLFCWTGHCVELVLQLEDPVTFSAFKMSGYTPAQVLAVLMTQSYWQQWCHLGVQLFVMRRTDCLKT